MSRRSKLEAQLVEKQEALEIAEQRFLRLLDNYDAAIRGVKEEIREKHNAVMDGFDGVHMRLGTFSGLLGNMVDRLPAPKPKKATKKAPAKKAAKRPAKAS